MDEAEKLAEILEHMLTKYEGAEDDPVWEQAKKTLERMKPKPLFLFCPQCGFLHVDEDEWALKPHRTHLCTECGHKWRPHAYPTVGIAIADMDARESMGFLRFFDAWQRSFKSKNPGTSESQLKYLQKILGEGWSASRDYWLAQTQKTLQKRMPTTAEQPIDVEMEHLPPPDEEDEEVDEQIAQFVQEGKLTWEDVDNMGFNPYAYIRFGLEKPDQEQASASPEETEELAEELGIEFDEEVSEDSETGIIF